MDVMAVCVPLAEVMSWLCLLPSRGDVMAVLVP